MTVLLGAYGALSRAIYPFALRAETRKLASAGIEARAGEKAGHAGVARPDGPLIWVHAASVGESLSALALIERLALRLEVLVTTGTATSAALMEARLPPGARHQFAPLDAPRAVGRFLDHWRPQAALFVESELWPGMLSALDRLGIPRALVNARLSEKALAGWSKRPATARALFAPFALVLTQTTELAEAVSALGAREARAAPNLKSLARPLPEDAALMAAIPRPAWVAASTHPGEEDHVLAAHETLLAEHPELTLLLAPRHPERGSEVAGLIAAKGWPAPRRSKGDGPDGPVWLLDTLGELGSLYAGSGVVFLGGSLEEIGGHNPFEPALAGAAIVSGPQVANFRDTFARFAAEGAVEMVEDAAGLAREISRLLSDAALRQTRQAAAKAIARSQTAGLDDVETQISKALRLPEARERALQGS